jgi:hypothetical protein
MRFRSWHRRDAAEVTAQATGGHARQVGYNRQQPVVQAPRRTEMGEAPGWQGATIENTGSI